MKLCTLYAILIGLAIAIAASAQDATTPAPAAPQPGQNAGTGSQGGWQGGQRGWGAGGGMGRGLMGTVTEVAADHYTIKNDAGESYTVHFNANTRIMKQQARPQGAEAARGGGGQAGQGGGQGGGWGGGNPPAQLKPADIKVGDTIAAMGEVDAAAKSVGATVVMEIDPERARQMHEMQANYGKTWLLGKVTAIDGVKVTLMGAIDNAPHTFVADENTTFRKRREPITLADIQVGDSIRVDGAMKDGAFVATGVSAMGGPPAGTATVPRNGAPPPPPPPPHR
jgi:hypothetical protein